MYITLDSYYPVEFYNEAKEALKNNGIIPKEYISIKSPYEWYFQVDDKPIMVNYDILPSSQERYLVNKVQALTPSSEYLLLRRSGDTGKIGLNFIENQPMKEARESDFAIFFNATNAEQLKQITKEIPVKIYYFGRYMNRYKVAMCTNKMILNYIGKEDILVQKDKISQPGAFEAELNFKVFKNNDMLQKYTETTYFENGKYNSVKIKADRVDAVRGTI